MHLTPFGEQRITVDLTPPVVEQVRTAGGELVIEVSEEVSAEGLAQAVAAGDFALIDTAAGEPLEITVAQPVETGRQKRRRLIVTTCWRLRETARRWLLARVAATPPAR